MDFMSKSFKYKDNNYLDSSGVVYNHNTLNNILTIGFFRGIYNILVNTHTLNGASTDTFLETRYRFKDVLLELYPTNNIFTRKYILIADINTSDRTNIILKIGGTELFSTSVWGANNANSTITFWKDVTNVINSLNTGHKNVTGSISISGTTPTSIFAYVQNCKLLVYDIPK